VKLREVLNGIIYIVRGGCSWRMMPKSSFTVEVDQPSGSLGQAPAEARNDSLCFGGRGPKIELQAHDVEGGDCIVP